MRVLLLNQCFYPDHVATAQYLTDLAHGLKEAGHEVTVVASSRGYDDPTLRYPTFEKWEGMEIHRIWTPGLGKKAKWRRWVDFASFWLSATLILLKLPRFDVTVCLTSPPLISTLGTAVAVLKGGKVVPWVMDLNPDEAVAAGWLKQGGLAERVMTFCQNWSFRRAAKIIALDRFMAERLRAKEIPVDVIHTDPPWSHDDALQYDEAGRAIFRAEHGLADKFVVMYSGNHSPCHPLNSLLQAAKVLRSEPRFHFLFVGGGSEMAKVKSFRESEGLGNITTLPYQPLASLAGSLSAADLHVVVLGEPFVGMVHPCKIYNIMALGIPSLSIAPAECHLVDLGSRLPAGAARFALPGDAGAVVEQIRAAASAGQPKTYPEGRQLAAEFGMGLLRSRLITVIERCLGDTQAK